MHVYTTETTEKQSKCSMPSIPQQTNIPKPP